ncbi:transmembrane channel-like protein [Pectinophora gossypiella]|uniref:transmembrane channel-like protein n=1 Tax=Pectinophora gossypiella TaxID=13191 RepID=UPI00214EB341|nr:transmembrane channel-like protein [Pectinophora gossypiella]
MASGVNLFHLPSEPVAEVKFSPSAGDGSEDEDYSASLSAVLRQRRASVRRSRKGRARRPSSPFLPDETRTRRRSSVFTTSSGDTAISMEEGQPAIVTQEQIFENIHLHKEVLGSVKQQPLGMRRKLKLVHQAKAYIKRHEGQLQERLAQSKSTRDIYARFNILLATKWQQLKREAANTSNLLIPWELRIKEIESHFGSVVASYFTFLRWLFWVNLVIAFILLVFVIVPEYLTANPQQDGERKIIMEDELRNASNLLTLWEFEGILKFSPIFYGYYSNLERPEYRMPLAYFLTGLVVYIYSFVAILRKMAENSRMSKLSEKEDECIFSWKLFTGWDFMIGNAETAHNRIASVILGFKEALLEEAEKKKDVRNWRIISLRALVNICVVILLAVSAYAVVTVVSRSHDTSKARSWWRENETTTVVTVISITFPVFFELLGFLEHYHPRKQLRLQLARIMLLNLLNLYSLIFALFSKIEGMSKDLDALKPTLSMNATTFPNSTLNISESLALNVPMACFEVSISCAPCNLPLMLSTNITSTTIDQTERTTTFLPPHNYKNNVKHTIIPKKILKNRMFSSTSENPKKFLPQNLIEKYENVETTTEDIISLNKKQLDLLKAKYFTATTFEESSSEEDDDSYTFDYETSETNDIYETSSSSEISVPYSVTQIDNFSSTSPTYGYTDNSKRAAPKSDSTETTDSTETDTETTDTIYYTPSTYQFDLTGSSYTTNTEFSTDVTTVSIKEVDTAYTNGETKSTAKVDLDTETTYMSTETDSSTFTNTDMTPDLSTIATLDAVTICPDISFNCSVNCGGRNVTQVFVVSNCTLVEKRCYTTECKVIHFKMNTTMVDVVYEDEHKRRMYNLTIGTKKKLLKLCWETMFGQELVKLTMMDLVFVLLGTLFMDFFRALFVRYMNRCWCWDLEKKFPEYGDFKIAENILHLINNQGMVWMGMFFSPGLVVLNVSKLMIMMYLRSWAVMTCNVPHEVVFRVSKSNNFYLALLLTMLFLCVLPVGYTIVWVKPSWHCGPFSEYDKIYYILTSNIYKILPKSLNFALEYIASPAIVIPLLVLLILIIYYLTSLTNSLREANNDLKIQLRRERTEERRKMFQLADTRRRAGSSALDNTPFARWKKALPALPLSKSIDSDDRKTVTGDEGNEPLKAIKKRGGGIFAKIVGLALDKKSEEPTSEEVPPSPNTGDDETDTDFHETLPKEVLKIKDITISKPLDQKKKNNVEFKTETEDTKHKDNLKVKVDKEERSEKRPARHEEKRVAEVIDEAKPKPEDKQLQRKQTSESNTSKQSDSFGSVIPVITISTTESDDEVLQSKKGKDVKEKKKDVKDKEKDTKDKHSDIKGKNESKSKKGKSSGDLKALRRQSSVDSSNEPKMPKEKKGEEGHKYQYSL